AGEGTAVLLRALDPLQGLDLMYAARPAARKDRDLCSGPARLAQALGIDRRFDGEDLASGAFRIVDDGTPPPASPTATTRVGITRGVDSPWRWYVPGHSGVSRR